MQSSNRLGHRVAAKGFITPRRNSDQLTKNSPTRKISTGAIKSGDCVVTIVDGECSADGELAGDVPGRVVGEGEPGVLMFPELRDPGRSGTMPPGLSTLPDSMPGGSSGNGNRGSSGFHS
jgi:hypothetical protein